MIGNSLNLGGKSSFQISKDDLNQLFFLKLLFKFLIEK